MKRGTIIVLTLAAGLLLLGSFAIYHTGQLERHHQVIEKKELEIAGLSEDLDKAKQKSQELAEQNQVYADSIAFLNREIVRLNEIIKAKDEEIAYLKGKLQRRNVAYEDLKDKIGKLYKRQKLDRDAIAKLEQEKANLRKEMKSIQSKTQDAKKARMRVEEDLASSKGNLSQMTEMQDVATFATVLYKEIVPRKFEGGKKITKMRMNMNGWEYTDIRFQLDHPNHRALLGKQFILKIYDKENRTYLAYLEENPRFPQSNNLEGIPFKFDGNMVELTYTNFQKKKSENYEIQIFLLDNGREVLLKNGKKILVSNGRFKV